MCKVGGHNFGSESITRHEIALKSLLEFRIPWPQVQDGVQNLAEQPYFQDCEKTVDLLSLVPLTYF